uniref:Uridylate-specific endoribonuclease n=1 Tax=Astyanax mexicanus TaxID=7994 RepID=A0A8B9HR27_ASTMX
MVTKGACATELSAVLNELWKLDVNRLKPGKDYTINLQGKADYVAQGSNRANDKANVPLFTYVNEGKLKSIPTYARFISLLDNYEMSTGVSEQVTSQEQEEENLFLDAILKTEVMKRAHQHLVSKKQAIFQTMHHTCATFCFTDLFVLWVCGVYFNHTLPTANDHVVNLQFSWKDLVKPTGSSFIGVSPEFEMALFTIAFLMSNDRLTKTVVKVDKYLIEIVMCRHGRAIGTSYPKLLTRDP